MPFCGSCGSELNTDAAFCGQCGRPAVVSAAASPPFLPKDSVEEAAQPLSAPEFTRPHVLPPIEVWAVIVLLAACSVFVLIPSCILIKDALTSFGSSAFSRAFALLVLEFAILFAAVGLGCLAITWLLFLGDRVGQALGAVVCGSVAVSETFNSARTTADDIALFVAILVVVALCLLPGARRFFAADDQRPVGVVLTTVLVAILAWDFALAGIMLMPLGRYESRYLIYGILMLVGSVALAVLNRQLRQGNQGARVVASLVLAGNAVVTLLVEHGAAGSLVTAALAASAVGGLWIPRSSQSFFTVPTSQPLRAGFAWPWTIQIDQAALDVGVNPLVRLRQAALAGQRRTSGGPIAYVTAGALIFGAAVLALWSATDPSLASSFSTTPTSGTGDTTPATGPTSATTPPRSTRSEGVTNKWTITETDSNDDTFTVTVAVGSPEPYTSDDPPHAQALTNDTGGIAAGDGCSLTQGSDAVVPALITIDNQSSKTLAASINMTGVGGSSIPGIDGTSLEWEADYGSGSTGAGNGTCDNQVNFGLDYTNLQGSGQLYGFFDITGYYSAAASESDILDDTTVDVPSDQSTTINSNSYSFTVTNVTGPGVAQSSDGWEFDLAGVTPDAGSSSS